MAAAVWVTVETTVVVYAVVVSRTVAYEIDVSCAVDAVVVNSTVISLYERVLVMVSKTTSADGVTVETTGAPYKDVQDAY